MAGRVPDGLCATCAWRREVRTGRGSVFTLCERSKLDRAFPKYPRLPVLACRGYEAAASASTSGP